jgi:hypothetical protein
VAPIAESEFRATSSRQRFAREKEKRRQAFYKAFLNKHFIFNLMIQH